MGQAGGKASGERERAKRRRGRRRAHYPDKIGIACPAGYRKRIEKEAAEAGMSPAEWMRAAFRAAFEAARKRRDRKASSVKGAAVLVFVLATGAAPVEAQEPLRTAVRPAAAVAGVAPSLPLEQPDWQWDPISRTVARRATIDNPAGGVRAELMIRCRRGGGANVAVTIDGGPARSMPVGLARVDNADVVAVNVETRMYPEGALTIALVSPTLAGRSLLASLRAGAWLRVAVDFPELPEAVNVTASLQGFTAQERRRC